MFPDHLSLVSRGSNDKNSRHRVGGRWSRSLEKNFCRSKVLAVGQGLGMVPVHLGTLNVLSEADLRSNWSDGKPGTAEAAYNESATVGKKRNDSSDQ